MLYVTTRGSRDAFTANRSMTENRGPDGGLYIPFRMTSPDAAGIQRMMGQGFSQCIAEILNLFFSAKLTGWDVDFCVGRSVCRLNPMNHRMVIAEVWHNQQQNFDWVVRRLSARMKNTDPNTEIPSDWVRLAVRLGTIFGVFSELRRSGEYDGEQPLDIAVAAGDFSGVMAAWYAREMGLNVGTIICACNENSNPWDLLNYGQMRTDSVAVSTSIPEADHAVPTDLERLIHAVLGQDEAVRFSQVCKAGRAYSLNPAQTEQLRQGIFAAVVGCRRMESVIPRVYRTNGYLLDPCSALAYGGVQDYRAKTGEVRPTLIIMEKSPAISAEVVAKAMGMTVPQLKDRFSLD